MSDVVSDAPRVQVGISVAVWSQVGGTERILLGKRKGSHGAGTWGMPGGKLEFGEMMEQCAIRETLDETGLTIVGSLVRTSCVTEDFFEATETQPAKHFVTLYFEMWRFTGVPEVKEPDKCEEWRWFALDELPPDEELMSGNPQYFAHYEYQHSLPKRRRQNKEHG